MRRRLHQWRNVLRAQHLQRCGLGWCGAQRGGLRGSRAWPVRQRGPGAGRVRQQQTGNEEQDACDASKLAGQAKQLSKRAEGLRKRARGSSSRKQSTTLRKKAGRLQRKADRLNGAAKRCRAGQKKSSRSRRVK